MSDYAVGDLEEALLDEYDSWNEFHEAVFTWGTEPLSVDIPGFGTAEGVAKYGGEGQGEEYWYVFKVTDAEGIERFFKVDGYYQSYDGGDYDTMFEVAPEQRVVTVYESV